jgi:hypothetical protein
MLKALVTNNRVPVTVDASTGIRLSAFMAKVCESCSAKQKSIDESFESKAEKIRTFYATRMAETAKKLAKDGDAAGAKVAEARVTKAANLKDWLAALGAEGAATAAATTLDPIVGVWNWKGSNVFTFAPDGSLRRDNDEKPATWKRLSQGKYQVTWNDGAWHVNVSVGGDGKSLDGTNQEGGQVRAVKIPAAALSGGDEPLVGVWKWESADALYSYSGDGTAFTLTDRGTWKLESKEGNTRHYAITWNSGGVVDRITISGKGGSMKGVNSQGRQIAAQRVLPQG